MTEVATAEKIDTPTMEERIATALKAPDGVSAETIALHIKWATASATAAENAGREAGLKSVDPQCTDGVAERSKAEDQEFIAQRFKNAVEALTPHQEAALKREAQVAWEIEAGVVRQKVTDLAKELATTWPDTVMRLVKLFEAIAAVDREASSINSRAPTGVNHLRGVEASIGKGEKIIERVKLPVLTDKGVVDMWPPRNNWALDYASSVHAGIVGAGMPPTEAERVAEGERVIAHAREMEAGRLRLNNELAARVRANDAEIRRLSNGG
jgi:hypothetical protein